MLCTFQGTAARIEVGGEGTTSLVRAEAFVEGVASRVDLLTARVGSLYPPVAIEAPVGLDPIDLDPSARSYKATYDLVAAGRSGPALRIDIEAGAARSGRYQGVLAGAPVCARDDGCEVQWQDAKHIALLLHPADARVAAAARSGAPIRLTGKFPFTDPQVDPAHRRVERLDRVVLEGAEGTFSCDDGAPREATGRMVWAAGPDQSLRIEPGIFLTPKGLRLTMVSSFAPAREPVSGTPSWVIGALAALLVVVIATALFLLRRRKRRSGQDSPPAGTGAEAGAGAGVSSLAPSHESAAGAPPRATSREPAARLSPLAASREPAAGVPSLAPSHESAETPAAREAHADGFVLLAVLSDASFAEALAKQLRPYDRPIFNPHDHDSVQAGADLLTEASRAIEKAGTVAVLVSADFFSAPEPWPALLALAMRLRSERGLHVVPVLCRAFAWDETELAGLAPAPSKGVIGSADNDAALADVARALASTHPSRPPPA